MKKLTRGCGAEADETPRDFSELRDAFFAAQVLVFRKQDFTAGECLEFAKCRSRCTTTVAGTTWTGLRGRSHPC